MVNGEGSAFVLFFSSRCASLAYLRWVERTSDWEQLMEDRARKTAQAKADAILRREHLAKVAEDKKLARRIEVRQNIY